MVRRRSPQGGWRRRCVEARWAPVSRIVLPALPSEGEATRRTLHAYAKCVAAVPRAHGVAHPKWWHLSLKVRPDGLVTDPVPLPDGGSMSSRVDVYAGAVVISTSGGSEHRVSMTSGVTATEFGDEMVDVVTGLGLEGGYDRSRFEDDSPREYDPAAARAYFAAFTAIAGLFERRRVTLGDRVGPVQLWPHGFDLAFEWFGTKSVPHEGRMMPTQINLGFFPGSEPYVYSSPWPFDDGLTDRELPHGAMWNVEGWRGAMLAYETVRTGDAAGIVDDFASAVFDLASPQL
jgi:hypothetical protein